MTDPLQKTFRIGLGVVALLMFAIALGTAYISLNEVLDTWLQYQWVPIARAVLGIGVATGALAAMWALLKR